MVGVEEWLRWENGGGGEWLEWRDGWSGGMVEVGE